MSYQNNIILALFMGLVFYLLFFSGCGELVNLKQIEYTVYPSSDNTVLPNDTAVLIVSFNTPMEQLETQKALSVNYSGGVVKGDLEWRGDTLFFTPLEPWLPGTRYTLSLTGMISAKDCREERVSRYVYFYALHTEAAPYVLSFTPSDGESVAVTDDTFIKIVFSQPMEPFSSDSFSLEGSSNNTFLWVDNDTTLEVHPKNRLNPWTVYRWSLNTKAKGKNGVPLGREIKGQFITDKDRTLPEVTAVYPLIGGTAAVWVKTGAAMDSGFGSGQAIGIEFNKAMDESVLRNIRFDPSLSGRSEMWKDNTAVFIPDRDPEPDRTYTLYISADSRDTEGLKMEKEYFCNFIPDIPYLNIIALNAGDEDVTPEQDGKYPAAVKEPDGLITVIARFSNGMDLDAQAMTALTVRLEPFFPATLRPIALRAVWWTSADTVIFQWEGIRKSTALEKHYYRLVFPGGRGGISDGKGSYLKEDTHLFLLAEEE
jgi:hypothetical protein